jgi:hypothetical protein
MKRLLPFFFFILLINRLQGQEKEDSGIRILMQGIVMDARNLSPIPNTQIWVNKSFTSISNKDGTFGLYVNILDTLDFSSLGYVPIRMIISDTLAGSPHIAGIYMNSDTLSIGEVVIVPRISNLKSDILNAPSKVPREMENAKYNVAVSAYQGRTTTGKLGDAASNYELLRQRQKVDAFEKGGIPSDRIVGISPFMLLPAAYLLLHGLPEKPSPMKPEVTDYELELLNKKFLEDLKKENRP